MSQRSSRSNERFLQRCIECGSGLQYGSMICCGGGDGDGGCSNMCHTSCLPSTGTITSGQAPPSGYYCQYHHNMLCKDKHLEGTKKVKVCDEVARCDSEQRTVRTGNVSTPVRGMCKVEIPSGIKECYEGGRAVRADSGTDAVSNKRDSADITDVIISMLSRISSPQPLHFLNAAFNSALSAKNGTSMQEVEHSEESAVVNPVLENAPSTEIGQYIYLSGLNLINTLSKSSSCRGSSISRDDITPYQVQTRAAITPIPHSLTSFTRSAHPVLLHYRTSSVGVGNKYDVDLSLYGDCCNVRGHLADIYYNETGAFYELVNTSECGTGCQVDDVLYIRHQHVTPAPHQPTPDTSVDYKLRTLIQSNTLTREMPVTSRHGECSCEHTKESADGWQGPARLHHGSTIRFGCINFLFAIVPPYIQ